MSLFSWLFIGHLLGDWLLQNDWMAKGKKTGFFALPGLSHYFIYTVSVVGALALSCSINGNSRLWSVLFCVIFVSHWLVDASGIIEGWMRFFRQSRIELVRVMVDQSFHILVLALLAAFLAKN